MSEEEQEEFLDFPAFDSNSTQHVSQVQRAHLALKLVANGAIEVDWTEMPRHPSCHRYIIHYRSLNNKQRHAVPVSRRQCRYTLEKIPPGHLYEVHVCEVDRSNQILDITEVRQIQSLPTNEAPTLRVTKTSPDSVWLEWTKSPLIRTSQIQSYKLVINGETKALFPAKEDRFIVNDGELGKRYVFQIEMISKDGRMIASLPVTMHWPGVTLPDRNVTVNGNDQVIITWGDSSSINDGQIESYTVYLYDSNGDVLKTFGPFSSECHQVWIKDLKSDIYFYTLEIKLADSTRLIRSKPQKIQCGRQSIAPRLTCEYVDSKYKKQLIDLVYLLIHYHDTLKSRRLVEKTDDLLHQSLLTLGDLVEFIRINLIIESRASGSSPPNHRLLIDGRERVSSIPWFIREFPLELPRREKPYEITVSLVPDCSGITSEKVLVEASGHFSFFCAHFDQQRSNQSCSYVETFLREKQMKQPVHQGLLKVPQPMKSVQLYDVKNNQLVHLPSPGVSHRLTILFYFLTKCVPSSIHLKYFVHYAASHRLQFNYIAVHCREERLGEIEKMAKDYEDVLFYSDFSQKEFRYEKKENEKAIHQLLSVSGVPMYSILDFSGQIVWKGRLCVRNQEEYDQAMDQMIAEVNQISGSADRSEEFLTSSRDEDEIEKQLNDASRLLQSITQKRTAESIAEKQEQKSNRKRQVVSMKRN